MLPDHRINLCPHQDEITIKAKIYPKDLTVGVGDRWKKVKEKRIKVTMKYNFIFVRLAKI